MTASRALLPPTLAALLTLSACSGAAAPHAAAGPANATEAEWRALATPRPAPLPGAARVSVGDLTILGDPWDLRGPVDTALGVSELIVAGLLRRSDVILVERRRFAAAAEAERRGLPRPAGAPPAGVAPAAEFLLSGTWASVGLDSAYLELHLADVRDGGIVASWRAATPHDADVTALTRTVIGSLLTTLEGMGRRPAWNDPVPDAAFASYRESSVPAGAVEAFFTGLAAEERYDWEGARRGYEAALARGGRGFVEAAAALARAARLRNGGTLGASR